jgi:poly(hydroxyalkanoate) granule-associated protein
MATKKKPAVVEEIPTEEEVKEEGKHFLDAVHKVLLASIGAVALAQEEIEDFVYKLVERGEIAEKDGRKLVRDVMDRRKKETEKAEDQLSRRVEDILAHMNVPSKTDIDTLGEKVAELTKKVDELKKA